MSVTLTLPVDDETLARVDELAQERHVSRDDILRFALLNFLDTKSLDVAELLPWQIEKIEAGRAAADRGEFASPEEIERIFSKYALSATSQDSYLVYLFGLFHEWNSPGDHAAFDDL